MINDPLCNMIPLWVAQCLNRQGQCREYGIQNPKQFQLRNMTPLWDGLVGKMFQAVKMKCVQCSELGIEQQQKQVWDANHPKGWLCEIRNDE